MKTGYCITTKRFTLRCNHPIWFLTTQEHYNRVVLFYYHLLLEHSELHSLSNQKILRELEILSIPGRDKAPVPNPLPYEKVPLYFRRAAINAASALVKSYLNRGGCTRQAVQINASVVYYKGMYRDLTENRVTLKVFDGENWHFMDCRLSGNHLPDNGEILSPTVVLSGKEVRLHVPVREDVGDARTSKERMASGENICSIQFTNSDAFAVACVLQPSGGQLAVRFFTGGMEYGHLCRKALDRIEKSELSRRKPDAEGKFQRDNPEREKTNQKYWMYLKHLSEHYAHQVSSRIISFCQKQEVKMIVMAVSDEKYSRAVMISAGNWSPLHLSVRIREYLSYKAWKAGIVVLETAPGKAGAICSVCGAKITKKKELYECINGHRGNRYLNTARNLGMACLKDFQRKL